jgi:hypothetical protein
MLNQKGMNSNLSIFRLTTENAIEAAAKRET